MHTRLLLRCIAPICLLLSAGCATTDSHPLQDSIWHVGEERFVDRGELLDILRDTHFIILGEIHDHAGHHRIQAEIIDGLAADRRRPVIAMEMIDSEQDEALAAWLADEEADAAGLGEAVGWEASGWPSWTLYQPIAETALKHELVLAAASRPRDQVREVARKGLGSLALDEYRRLGLTTALPEAQREALGQRLREAHCDMLPDEALPGMLDAQRLRDAHMARRMRSVDRGDGVVLITGNGHAHTGYGVPWYLQQAGQRSVFSVGLLPVDEDGTAPQDYVVEFDAVWFTGPVRGDQADPCAAFEDSSGDNGGENGEAS